MLPPPPPITTPLARAALTAAFFAAGSTPAACTSTLLPLSSPAALATPVSAPLHPSVAALAAVVDPPSTPSLAPLLRAALQTDPALGGTLASTVGDTPAHRFTTPAAFWRAYLARLAVALFPTAPTSPAAPPPARGIASAGGGADSDGGEEEVVLLTVQEVFCYRLPPRPAAAGHRAADWGLDAPAVTGWLRVTAQGESGVVVIVWSKGDGGASGGGAAPSLTMAPAAAGNRIVAACRIPFTPPPSGTVWSDHPLAYWLEPVVDSTRYFVMRGASPRPDAPPSMLGIGFRDRQHAFDLKSAILDHAAFVERQRRGAAHALDDVVTRDGATGADEDTAAVINLASADVEVAERWETTDAGLALPPGAANTSLTPLREGERIVVRLGGGAAAGGSHALAAGVTTGVRTVPKLAPPRSAVSDASAPAGAGGSGGDAAASATASGAAQQDDDEWGDFVAEPAPATTAPDVGVDGVSGSDQASTSVRVETGATLAPAAEVGAAP